MSLEKNHEEFKEIRSRVDSISNAIFLIAGGSLSISIGLILRPEVKRLVTPELADNITSCWYWLLASVISLVLLKSHLIVQLFTLQWKTKFLNTHVVKYNTIGFLLGTAGVVAFIVGTTKLVMVATRVISA